MFAKAKYNVHICIHNICTQYILKYIKQIIFRMFNKYFFFVKKSRALNINDIAYYFCSCKCIQKLRALF